MTRLNLSFVAAFLVLATCAVSAPTGTVTQRDEGHSFGLAKTLGNLEGINKIMDGLDQWNEKGKQDAAAKAPAADTTQKGDAEKGKAEDPAAAGKENKVASAPTPTEKNLYSGNFATPTASHTHHPSSVPNALGKLPVVGGLLGGTGGPL